MQSTHTDPCTQLAELVHLANANGQFPAEITRQAQRRDAVERLERHIQAARKSYAKIGRIRTITQ